VVVEVFITSPEGVINEVSKLDSLRDVDTVTKSNEDIFLGLIEPVDATSMGWVKIDILDVISVTSDDEGPAAGVEVSGVIVVTVVAAAVIWGAEDTVPPRATCIVVDGVDLSPVIRVSVVTITSAMVEDEMCEPGAVVTDSGNVATSMAIVSALFVLASAVARSVTVGLVMGLKMAAIVDPDVSSDSSGNNISVVFIEVSGEGVDASIEAVMETNPAAADAKESAVCVRKCSVVDVGHVAVLPAFLGDGTACSVMENDSSVALGVML
jgi:hypothetical protein